MLPDATFAVQPADHDLVAELRRELRCTETLAWVLASRGIDAAAARQLIGHDTAAQAGVEEGSPFHDPFLLGDMRAAVERIQFAIQAGQTIVVHGDYDADGVCSTTVLVEALEALGAQVRAFLPNRFTNGYGLQLDSVERFARDGAQLLITVDCGITAVEAVDHANDLGLDVIVCDHHRPGARLPAAIICSTQPSDYPFPELCATAVAGKLAEALGAPCGPRQHELEAIATVADCVSLTGENRAIVQRGLAALRSTTRPGLRALLSQCGLQPNDVDADAIAFKVAPRINAVGRLGDSERGYELLRASEAVAPGLAQAVQDCNEQRRAIERDISAQAITQVEGWSAAERAARIYVVDGPGWHEGVVGIVASRLVERYGRPVVVIADSEPLARGSGRSIDGVNLHAALATASDLLVRWGGHAQAAGVTLEREQVPALRQRLAEWALENVTDALMVPSERIDAILHGRDLTMELIEELERLAPFGTGWTRPRLLAAGARVDGLKAVGADGSHLKLRVHVGDGSAPGIAFGMGALIPALLTSGVVDVALRPTINRFRGVESLQVEVDRIFAIEPVVDGGPGAAKPPVAGWCATGCTVACGERLPLGAVLAGAGAASDVAGANEGSMPALEPLLALAGTLDLRHRGLGTGHVARLASAGLSQLVVCSDVARRRELFELATTPLRFGTASAALASDRCAPLGIGARLGRLERAAGTHVVLADYGALAQVLDGHVQFDAVVVLDPPASAAQRDVLVQAAAGAPLHLVFGAEEQRFSLAVAAAVGDVRGTLAPLWRRLREDRSLSGTALEGLLFGTGELLHSPTAVRHGLHVLTGKGLVTIDEHGSVQIVDGAPSSS